MPESSKRKNSFRRPEFQCPSRRRWMRGEPPNADLLTQSRLHRRAEFQAPNRASQLPTPLEFLPQVRGVCPGGLSSNWKDPHGDISMLAAYLRLAVCWPLKPPQLRRIQYHADDFRAIMRLLYSSMLPYALAIVIGFAPVRDAPTYPLLRSTRFIAPVKKPSIVTFL